MRMEQEMNHRLGLPTQYLSLLPNNPQDWHFVLQARSLLEFRPEIMSHFKKQERQESVGTNNEPIKTHLSENENGCKKNEKEGKNGGNETFWTVCPYCYYIYEYEKDYEECCLRCQNCKRAFHGVAMVEPNKNMLVKGKDEYFCGFGFFALKYSLNGNNGLMENEKAKESGGEGKSYDVGVVIEISDDSDNDGGGEGRNVKSGDVAKEEVLMGNGGALMQGSGKTGVKNEGKRVVAMKNVKSVARKSKKVMGRGVRIRGIETTMELGSTTGGGDDCSESDLEFTERW